MTFTQKSTNHSWKLFIFFFILSSEALFSQTPCNCTNCPQFMPDGFTGSFYLNVQNACNPILGQNGQGVCGVRLHLEHEYIGDLRITLTSPSGQNVTLIGPVGFFGGTDFTDWDVTFVPCTSPAAPDPGFSNTWNNNQAWGLNGNYSGSYYPSIGCLNTLTGPVNGQWTLTVFDQQAIDVGTFFDYEIIFCDPSCIDCFTCAANAGQLQQADVSACAGSSTLNLNLPPTYTTQSPPPPASEYSYTYVISQNPGGVIIGYDADANLSSFAPGSYTVCGLSYLNGQEPLFPAPNGSLTTAQLLAQLNSSSPPFCGRITTNCVNVTVNPAPNNIIVNQDLCAPQCTTFFGTTYCNTGVYVRNLTQNGCPYTATLVLNVMQPVIVNVRDTICEGNCSIEPGFPNACSAGIFNRTIPASGPGQCDTTVRLVVTMLITNVVIPPPQQLSCTQSTVTLTSTGSSPGSYQWTASNGGHIVGSATNTTAVVDEPGTYKLRVCRTNPSGGACCDSATVVVTEAVSTLTPPANINGPGDICVGTTTTYNTPALPGATSYTWTFPPGVVVNSGGTTNSVNVTWNNVTGGNVCVLANYNCGPSTSFCMPVTVNPTVTATTPQGDASVCASTIETYSIPVVPNAISYNWTVTGGNITSGQGTNSINVSWGTGSNGTVCVNTTGPCGPSPILCLPVTITSILGPPLVSGSSVACATGSGTYSVSVITGATSYNWVVTGGTITSGNGTTTIQVTWNAGATSGSVCATASNSCGISNQNCLNVTLNAPPAQPVISGDATLCSGTNGNYSFPAIPNTTGYQWTVTGGTIVSGQNTTNLVVNWGTGSGGTVCAAALSSCGPGPQTCFPVVVNALPNANAGSTASTCALTINLQAVNSVTGSTGAWTTVSGPGSATFANAASPTSSVTVSQPGAYTFRWTESNGSCTDDATVVINFNPNPTAGQVTTLCEGTNQSYTVSFPVSGGTPPYTIPGGTITNGVFTSNLILSGQSYSFVITDANGCSSAAVSGSFNCNCTSAAGQMSLQTVTACQGGTVTAQHLGGQFLDLNDVSSYVLHTNAGTSLGLVLAQNTTGTFSFQAGMTYGTTYYVSFVVGNNLNGFPDPADPCLSVAQGQPVIFYQTPAPAAGADAEICGLTIQLNGNAGNGTWSVGTAPAGGTITFSAVQSNTSAITASVHGAYTLVWTLDNNGCTATDQVIVTFNSAPVAGAVTHSCDPANENYTVTIPISGGEAPYSVNGTAIAGSSFVSAPIPSGQNYTFTISDANGCEAPVINGSFNCDCTSDAGQMSLTPLAACEGTSITAVHLGGQALDGNDVSAYVLHTSAGASLGTVIAQNATGTFSFQAGMTYGTTYYVSFVVGNNLNGFPDPADQCLSVSQGQPVVFHQNPVPAAGADAEICGLTIQLNGNTGNGTWSVGTAPAGGTITFDDVQSNSSEITASEYGAYTLIWTLDNNGCTVTDQVIVTFNDAPVAGTVTHTCDSANENYTVTIPVSGGEAPYSVNGTAIVGNIFVSAPIPNGQNYTFTISDANGCEAPEQSGSFNCDCTSAAGQMDLTPLPACEGESITATHLGGQTLDGNDVSAYVLHTSAGASLGTVIAQNATGIFSFQAGMTYGTTYYVSFVVGNNLSGFPNPADPCLSVAQGQPVVFYQNPVADAGMDNAVCGTIMTLAGSGGGNGQWTLSGNPPGGSLVIDDPQNPSTSVTASLPGQYTVVWTLEQNACTSTDEVILTFNDNPNLSDLVRTCDPANENYTVRITLAGGTPPYLVNNTAIADSVFVSPPLTNGAMYQYTVTDANNCTMPVINGSFSCDCATDAGSMSAATLTACDGTTVTAAANNDANLDGNDVTSFVLHNGSGQSLGIIYAQNTTGVFGIQAGMNFGVTYYISRVVGNPVNGFPNPLDPCFSVATGQPVIFLEIPTPDAGVDTEICGQSFDLQAITSGFSGTWTQTNGTGTATFTALSDANTTVTVPDFGVYTFQWEEVNGICSASDEVQITFNESPAVNGLVETCNGTNTQYTVTFTVAGGTAPYSATGIAGSFMGSDFTSNLLPNNSVYSFTVTDANGCESPDITGIKNCNCQTDAGTMVTTPLAFCADQPAVAPWNNDSTLDADDMVLFILHSQSGSILGTVYASSNQPSFTFGAGLQTGVTYYISAVAGNNVGGAIQLSDPCLSVSQGTPVQWRPLPTATLSGDATICEGSSTPLTFSGTGTFPLTVTYSTSSVPYNTLTIANQQELVVGVSPTATETYTLISVSSGNNPVCTTDLNESVTITINQSLSAGIPNDPVAFCVGTALPVQLANLLTDADPGGQWTDISTVPALPGGFNAQTGTFFTDGQPAGTYRFRYTRSSLAPCPSDEAVVEIVMNPLPVANAGEDKALNCNQTTTILGGPGTSSGAGITYNWTLNGAYNANTQTLLTSEPGTYELVVTNGFGCTASDAATVTLDNEVPVADLITVKDVRCWGDKNGSISVDAYTSTHPPVLFSLNGGPFTSQTLYAALLPGTYTVTLQDANGCEWTSDALVVREPPQLLLDLGANITVAQGDSVHLEALINVPFAFLDTLYWNPVMDTAKAGTLYQDFLPLVSNYIDLRIVDTNGCATSDRTLIVVDQERRVYIPNIIKVGSAENDVLTVFGGRDVAEIELFRVFDRWGDQLFEERNFLPNDVTKGWKGRYKDKEVNPGVFIYTAVVRFIDGERILFKGDVTVFK